MAWHPIKIDDSFFNTGGGSVKVAEGNYLFKLVSITPSKADYEGEPHYRVGLIFTDGPDPTAKGSKIEYIWTFKGEAQFSGGTIMEALGAKLDSFKGKSWSTYEMWAAFATTLATALTDKPVGGTVIDRTYNGKISSRVDKVWPAREWENRRGAVIASNQAPAAVGATNGTYAAPTPPTGPSEDFMADVNAMFPAS